MAESLPPVDESVAVPPAVKAAAERANAYFQQAQEPAKPEQTPEPVPVVVEAQTPEPPAPAPTPAPAAETPAHETQEAAQLRAELAKQQRDNKAMLGRLAQQREYIAMQQTQLAQLSNPRSWAQPEQPKQPKKLITDEERQAYGDEALSVMERKAREVVLPVVEQLDAKNRRLEQELQRVKANDVYATLDDDLPNWRDINRSDEWKDWLRLPDLYSGIVRQQLLDQAFAAGDAGRILAFFRGFLAESPGHTDPQVQAQAAVPPSPTPVRKAALKLEDLAAPGRAAPSPAPSATEAKPTITNKDISHFYWQVTHGHWNGREQAKAAREAEIHAAINAGRVQMVK